MLRPIDEATHARIRALSRTVHAGGREVRVCPCRVLPETVLQLKEVMREVERLWREELGDEPYEELLRQPQGLRLLAGRAWLVRLQPNRPEMVGVWLEVPADYPRRIKVQLVDVIEPCPPPDAAATAAPTRDPHAT